MKRINYAKLVPAESMLGRYLQYCAESETPTAYDFWTGCFLLSVALGRGVVVDRPGASVHLNLFAVLVAESGVTRKSTAVRRAVKFARTLCGTNNPLIESKITPELLEHNLAQQSIAHNCAYTTIMIDEMVKFLGREKYVETMPTLLTDLYDSPAIRTGGGSLSRGKAELSNVYVNFLSASTPSWLLRAVNPDVIEGGFTSRVIFVVAEEPKRSSPWPGAYDVDLEMAITADLQRVREQAQSIDKIALSEGALRRYATWYRSRDIKRDPFRSSFQSREDSHVLRVAALLAVNDGGWEIQANHIIAAIKVITECREDGASIFEGTGSHSRMVLGVDALRDKLLAGGLGGCKQGELVKQLQGRMNAQEIKDALAIMHNLGMVQQFSNIQVGRGRPVTLWRGTTALASGKALDQVIEGLDL